jgi:hypothetical protein
MPSRHTWQAWLPVSGPIRHKAARAFAIVTSGGQPVVMAKRESVSEVRAWAKQKGFQLGDRGRLPGEVWDAWNAATRARSVPAPRSSEPQSSGASAEDLQAALAQVARLEQQVAELASRLTRLENRPAEHRRLFARSR